MAITFRAKLWAPMEGKGWSFVTMPKPASARLPARGRVAVTGTINGFKFRSSAFPDGDGSHNIQVNGTMREGAKVSVGGTAEFSISPSTDTVKVTVPADLSAALKRSAKADALWDAITPKARAEWVSWITSAKKEETRAARTGKTIERLSKGEKRPS
jgi:Bacteriocin-protection, YdeI or OmpD-Associated/Domain of unknown function (DUF1905)